MSGMTPQEIVHELDKHIIGQAAAKRAVAIALRNRWRRQRVDEPLRQEITPKNILMIGPTGVGKTEIARRLAKLADAPFIKVEATKFTEVGYVGRDVDTIVRDLVEIAIKQTREADLALFVELGRLPRPSSPNELPMRAVIPAFAISELKTGFQMGFFLFVPFLLIDLVVSTTLLSMGMLQLPPAMVSLPFKILLFVMVDGWNLLVSSLVRSFA